MLRDLLRDLPQRVTIGTNAFSYCQQLTSVTLGSEDRIGYEAFRENPSLAIIVFTEGIQTIGDRAFYNCDALVTVSLPESMESIGIEEGTSGIQDDTSFGPRQRLCFESVQ